jgi:HlyD family secretion protein
MSRTRLRWISVAAVAAIVVALVAALFLPRPIQVDAAPVTVGPIAETVQDQGVTRVREAYVVAAPVSGRLKRVELHVGDRVEAGRTVIARIRPAAPDLLDPRARAQAQAAVAAASASVTAARATRERLAADARRSEQALARIRPLATRGFASNQALDNAEAENRATHAAVEAAAADLSAREAQLAAAKAALIGPGAAAPQLVSISSPATGYVTRVLQESERMVLTGTPLVEVSESRGLEAQIEFLSQDAVRIREGMPAELYDWGGPGVIRATVRRVEPEGFVKVSSLGVEEHRVLVMLQFASGSEAWAKMGPGYSVWGRVFLRQAPNALKVPLGALVGSGGGWAVYRITGGRAELTPVAVGAITDSDAEIRSGLKAGDEVVLFPSDRVRSGARVSPRDSDPPAAEEP